MARVRSIDFLPEIFQTPINRQFLSATLDQLIQEPKFQKTQGFIGRKVGPGVNPDDRYVIEPTKSRNDYQLEPGVVFLDPDNVDTITNAITYPGISDALALQGGYINNADRLYTSEYYSWDPFVDFDKFVNYQQYYWLPDGPQEVDVSASTVPLTDNFVVTRENGVYTMTGQAGNDPTLTLVRGGNYTFQVAQNTKEDINYRVTNSGISSYVIDYAPNPTLTLVRGNTYTFTLSLSGIFPFYIKTQASLGNNNTWDSGVTNNGNTVGTITFVVPQDAPDTLYYACSNEFNMRGTFNIIDGTPGTGPGFWIQTDPGVNGRLPAAPNISSRDVLGVTNNGEDLGTISFNVPYNTAQNFYYNLTDIGSVGFITTLHYDQINGQPVDEFIITYNGIDGVTDMNGRTLIFQTQTDGWGVVPESQWYGIWKINYVTVLGVQVIQLTSIASVNNLEKLSILFGTEYASTGWYKTAEGIFEQIPLLTAVRDLLFYQDGTDPEIFGQIRLIDQEAVPVLRIADILDKTTYTSPNGVVFTNGLKVIFRGEVEPVSYQNVAYYVEGVGTAIKLLPVSDFITPEVYVEEEYTILGTTDSTLGGPPLPDYLTINRASPDLNPWSRSNRWFHIDVITATAAYNNTIPVVDNLARGRRPILEFRAGTKLFDFGTEGKQPINVIDYAVLDAMSTVNGSIGYGIDGYTFVEGTRVIFAADTDPTVRNKIYEVQFIVPDTELPLIIQPIINLVPANDATVLINQSVVCLSGNTLQGKNFYFDGVDWLPAQNKIARNQAPLFDVYDSSGISFGSIVKYPSTTFAGSKLLSYATGSGVPDPVLGTVLKYLNVANIGDIVFDNNLYTDTFVYVENGVSITLAVSTGFVREYSNRIDYIRELGWQTAVTPSLSRQQFAFTYDGTPLRLDIQVVTSTVVPAVQLFVNSEFIPIGRYTVSTTTNTTTIILLDVYAPGSGIEVLVLSDQVSSQGFYQVPINLSNNPLNANSPQLTLGTVRSHYGSIAENLLALQGPINGANNTRDLGNIIPYGLEILQQSSPLTLTGYFARNLEFDIFASIEYNGREYIKYKSLLLDTVIRNEYPTDSVPEILDAAIADITRGRTDVNPFYWSDMLPSEQIYTQTTTTITPISTTIFDTIQTYDFTSANFKGLLVYLTQTVAGQSVTTLLLRGSQYVVSTDGPTLTVLVPLAVGDIVNIQEYTSTAGNFVPNTPTKMGLYPKFVPSVFIDNTYINPVPVIQGHDGSLTVAFGDIRDEILLEFEKRIYNNIKTDGNPIPLTIEDVAPGEFRTTDYTQTEITTILGESFLSWVGWNKLDYKAQEYIADNAFTYNYSSAGSKLTDNSTISNITETPLLGAWRGIYKYFYDTLSPNITPWEMLGLSEMPSWWENRYGPAPYTSDNLVLWDDLEAGLVADPVVPYVVPKYRRPGLTSVIPVGTEGQLLPPLNSVVGLFDSTAFRKSWVVGDGGPVEASWWSSSSYPFAVMRLLALTKPAEFFSLFADRDLYRYNAELGQVLYNNRYRLDANGIQVYGKLSTSTDGVSKASYINWIVDYNQQLGRNSTDVLTSDLANLDVRLCYRMASFSNKQYLKIFTEKSSPNSQNSSLLLPDESYKLLLYKNQPFSEIIYSALIIESVATGYAVYGYSTTSPYFEILASSSSGALATVSAGGATVRVPLQYTSNVVQVPYGYVFTNTTMVVDFILSYGAYLENQGLAFTGSANGYPLNWNQMAKEFLYFSQQGWANGTLINLNPVADRLTAYRANAVVDTIESLTPENMLLDQNRTALPTRDLIVDRNENTFTITSATTQTIAYLKLRFTNYEHMIVLDNVSIFADLLYDPTTGARQNRLRLVGSTTTEWNGQLDAQGFILNQNNVKEWQSNRKYTKGEIVLYKNIYWSAQTIIQPKLTFDYNNWVKADYQLIQEGLLPNIANKADQLANSYNTYGANLERDNDLLAYGLIGFRPRQYMAALNLDDVSQVNIYQQFLGTKGTNLAAELFTRADLGKESGAYNIYENWAVLAATYGANANRSFFELRLFENLLQSNPSVVQVVVPEEQSDADQTILLSQVWRESYKLTSPDILPTAYLTTTDTALPTAGYVNLADADITVFSIDDPSSISASIDTVGIGTIIWVAKVNSYDWNIYRCERVPGILTQISDNLNETSVVQFSAAHNLSVGDLIIIRYFDDAVNGVYRVLSVPGIQQVIISYNFVSSNQSTISGTGLAFYLQTSRVAQASDVASLPFANSLLPGAKAWVDNDGSGHWEVLEKQNPFTEFTRLNTEFFISNSQYGFSIAQATDHTVALIGAPGIDGAAGSVYTYQRDIGDNYAFNINLELNAIDTVGFGTSVAYGNKTWGVAGAPGSLGNTGYAAVLYQVPGTNDFLFSQMLSLPNDSSASEFGYAVAISQDERWMYIGAPAKNLVYAYGRVDIETQTAVYVTDGVTDTFNYSDTIEIDYLQPNQLRLALENVLNGDNVDLIFAINYTVTPTSVILFNTPAAGLRLTIARRQTVQIDSNNYYGALQNATTGYGFGAVFTINVTRGVYYVTLISGGQDYATADTLTIFGSVLGGTSPANNLTITVTACDPGGVITNFTYSGSGVGNTSTFDLQPFLYTATNIYSFIVFVNGIIQRPYIDYEFNTDSSLSTQDLTFIELPPVGAIIGVTSGTNWELVDTITISGLATDARFGTSITTTTDGRQVIIGSKLDDAVNENLQTISRAGAVYAIDRSVVRYIVTNATQTTYDIPGTFAEPVSVVLNNSFLTNTNQFIYGQFTVVGSTVVLSAEVMLTLTVGDILEIETNQFQQIQKIVATNPTDEAAFGEAVKICSNNCSVYTGAPLTSRTNPQEGMVQRNVNQSRVYGVITSNIANPVLVAGDTLRINNTEVTVPVTNTITALIATINSASIPNVVATATPNVTLVGDGITKVFGVGSVYSAASSYTTLVYIDTILQVYGVNYTYNNTKQEITFTTAPSYTSEIIVVSGRMTLSIVNPQAATGNNKLTVLPGTNGTTFDDLGFVTYYFAQTIYSPNPVDYAYFGSSLDIDTSAANLVVGAPNGNIYRPVTFDDGETYFDDRSTTFFSPIVNSGVAYTFDYLPSATSAITNPGAFVFGQQIYDTEIKSGDRFSTGISYRGGRLLVGAPGKDLDDSTINNGLVSIFSNPTNRAAWAVIYLQEPAVKIDQLNSVFMYDRLTSNIQQYFDYIDPLQGKILGAARRNIDYLGAVDPADYNVGTVHNLGNSWASEHVGEIWWDTDTVRFIDPNQDNITYASRRWGQVFPGSSIDIYQWVASTVPPISYTGPGIALSTVSYTVSSRLNQYNIFETIYYFWVRGITTVETTAGKTLSATGIASYIEDPRGSGIPYIAPINASTVAIYNALDLISASDTILHIEFDRQLTDANVHQEYQLIAAGKADAFLNDNLYTKLQDSFCGANNTGASVPDALLSPAERYGVQFRPRQSMFVNRFTALQNYLTRANKIFAQFPIVESRKLTLLNSSEPEPQSGSGAWNKRVANIEELSFQNLYEVPLGYKYLVVSDSTQNGLWTIYQVGEGSIPGQRDLNLVRVQNYDTRRYWTHIDWYRVGYNSTVTPVTEVPTFTALKTLTLTQVPIGSSAKVTANAQGKFEIYLRTDLGWERVGLQDGTISINEEIWNYAAGNFGFDVEVFDAQYFDQEPTIETRQIIRSINEEIFVDELAIERNLSLMLMFDFIYSEFSAPEWLIKTSLVDVDHKIRALKPYQNYLRDNQDFVLDYIQEVKPYHVQVREFNLTYYTTPGDETFFGDITDYDVPAYYNILLATPQFVSPVLTPYTQSGSFIQSNNSDTASNSELWTLNPWNQWFNNYLLEIQDVSIVNGGTAYTVAPSVFVNGVVAEGWTALINSSGNVVAVTIGTTLSGYTTTPIITLVGGNGTGALAVAVMGNNLVRSFRTVMKYDRYQYATTIVEWQPNVMYDNGTQVRYIDKVWEASNPDSSVIDTSIFMFDQWTLVDAGTLSGVDRTMGLYVSTVNQPGLSLPLLIDGIDYPGVQVFGPLFSQNTGYDVGNFDINPFDNLSYGPEGRPTYDPAILDAIYTSGYLDPYLGILPAPAYDGAPPNEPNAIVVAGGAYIDAFSSHAPEELIPGSEFDTLDLRVYTRSGADWAVNGHGFPEKNIKYTYDTAESTLSWANLVPNPDTLIVTNLTLGQVLNLGTDYTVDWNTETITIINGVSVTNLVVISVYGLGGGNQLYENVYNGAEVGNTLNVPVLYSQVQEFAIFVNGILTTDYTYGPRYADTGVSTIYNPIGSSGTTLEVGSTVGISEGSLIVGIGFTSNQTVITKVGATTLLISAIPDTTPDGMLTFLDNTGQTKIAFGNTYTLADSLTVTAIGVTTVDSQQIAYSWSTPQTQYIIATGVTLTYNLTNSLEYTNPDNLIVNVNKIRARTSAGIDFYGDGLSVDYPVAGRLGFSQDLIQDADIDVYLNDIIQTLNTDYIVQPYNPSNPYDGRRVVTFTTAPDAGVRILLTVNTHTQCKVVGSQLVFDPAQGLTPIAGDIITVTTWNDTRQQDLLTQVFVGPVETGIVISEGYASTDYDLGDITNEPGSYDYSSSTILVKINDLQLGRVVINPDRLWVTLNGRRLFYGSGFTISGEELVLSSGILGAADVVMITQVTESVVPEPMAFRIFQDMRGVQATYRITVETTTTLAQALSQTADIVYVNDASALGQPNVENNIWGVVTIDGERIMYRSRDTVNNTISSLLRGTAGTAAAAHDVEAIVYDMGRDNLLAQAYQNYIVSDSILANGFETVFTAVDIDIAAEDSTIRDETVEVYVGGIRVTTGYTIVSDSPVSIVFNIAPPSGELVTIVVRRGVTWYDRGVNTASNGVALQDTNNQAARFLRGL